MHNLVQNGKLDEQPQREPRPSVGGHHVGTVHIGHYIRGPAAIRPYGPRKALARRYAHDFGMGEFLPKPGRLEAELISISFSEAGISTSYHNEPVSRELGIRQACPRQ